MSKLSELDMASRRPTKKKGRRGRSSAFSDALRLPQMPHFDDQELDLIGFRSEAFGARHGEPPTDQKEGSPRAIQRVLRRASPAANAPFRRSGIGPDWSRAGRCRRILRVHLLLR